MPRKGVIKMRSGKIIATAILALAAGIQADQIKMSDGSVIIGSVKQILDGKVKVSTGFAGDLEIDSAKISSISTDGKINAATASGKALGAFGEDGFVADGSSQPVALSDVTAAWAEGAADPTLPKGRKWAYEASVDISGKTSNSEKADFGAGIRATLTGPKDRLALYLNGKHGRDNHVTTDKEVVGGADYERRIKESRHTVYGRGEYEYDRINDLDPSITAAAGYGIYALDKEDFKIRLRLGLSYLYKDYISDKDTDSSMGLDANYHHEFKVKQVLGCENLGTLVTDVTYTPSLEDMDDYRLYHESSLSMPLGGPKFWVLRIGVSNDYYNKVAIGRKHLDTNYFAKLVLTWE